MSSLKEQLSIKKPGRGSYQVATAPRFSHPHNIHPPTTVSANSPSDKPGASPRILF